MIKTMKENLKKQKKAKVFIVDDHPIVRHSLKRLIEEEGGLAICGEAGEGYQALKWMSLSKPDIALVDLGLQGGMNGLELIKNIKKRMPRLPILVISMHDEIIYAERALRAGAKGYIMKRESLENLTTAINQVLDGKVYLSDNMAERMLGKLSESQTSPTSSAIDVLSDRELEVFQLIGQGMKTGEISRHLCLGIKTIESYRERIKDKLKLGNAQELTRCAIQWMHSEKMN